MISQHKGGNSERTEYPITRQFRQELYDVIVKEFNAAMEQEEQQFP